MVLLRVEDVLPPVLGRLFVREGEDDAADAAGGASDDEVAAACKEALATSESVLVPPSVIYSCGLSALLCVVLSALCGFSVGYNTGVYSIPVGLDKVMENPSYAPSTSGD